ncbi:helix-hairpin-helix domain-containing protein [Methylobacterium sp. J-026]|uniref:helix-hairpin-helix domain-containing protein n=1 Tax=Methylobacterium sp. J-026 TaxID=2836624 RepID=UPI0028C40C5F|nr:helix-hairpin-helix domain-containing protein [Methylobacterium sp. J-026]
MLLIIAGVLAAVVQFLLPSPEPAPMTAPAPMAESPAVPTPPPAPPAAAEPAREPPAAPRTVPIPAGPSRLPSDALAFPPVDPATPPGVQAQAQETAGQAEVDRAEDSAGPRALAVVDLNTAPVADLNRLRGGGAIGRAIAAKRPYASVDQLLSKRVLSRALYDRIKDQVTVR